MQYYKLNKIVEYKIKPADFQILPAQLQIFLKIRKFQVRAYAIHAKLSDKERFVTKSHLKQASGLITIIGMLTVWKDLSFPQKLNLLADLHALVLKVNLTITRNYTI